jgi:hypothetical protein
MLYTFELNHGPVKRLSRWTEKPYAAISKSCDSHICKPSEDCTAGKLLLSTGDAKGIFIVL